MSKIRIKNFGPIKEGYQENGGWLDVKKVTVFIGNQGSGKSTVAKLISLFMWLEKALIRGDIKGPISHLDIVKLTEFHRLENYFDPKTEIEYEGASYHLKLVRDATNTYKKTIEATKLNDTSVGLPKIMYVPAERNFLSSIENINKVSDLIVGSLKSYAIEFRNAQLANKGKATDLPINNTRVVYEPETDENYLEFDGRRLKLSHASSGFHSIVPLYWVTKYMVGFVGQSEQELLKLLSTDQTIRRNNELIALNTLGLDIKALRDRERAISSKYVCKYFVNIVEEPEQNLFPSSQRDMLYSLLEFNNMNEGNKLIMTTHSPYLINYLSIAVKADELKNRIKTNEKEYESDLNKIVPISSTINPNELAIYEFDETSGTIAKLGNFEGIPSDKNFLNKSIREGNIAFDHLLEIEQAL
jgi:predicted ATPase